jgi:hypothetical protein
LYVAVMDFVPMVVKEVVKAAVPPAKAAEEAPMGTTATGLPICVPPLKNVTVPVVPIELLLVGAVMVAVRVTLLPVVTVGELEVSAVVVAAVETVTVSATGVVTAL